MTQNPIKSIKRILLNKFLGPLSVRLNNILQPLYQYWMCEQLAVVQAIPRTLVDYSPINYYGKDELIPVPRPENIEELGFLHIYFQPQLVPRPYYFFLKDVTVHDVEIYDPKNSKRLFLENDPELNDWNNRLNKVRIVQRWHAMRHARKGKQDLEEAYVFSNRAWRNYYHFVFDSCMKYVYLESSGSIRENTRLIIHEDIGRLKAWQKQYMNILGIDESRFVVSEKSQFHTGRKPLNVGSLLVASNCRQRTACSPDAIQTFQARIRSSLRLPDPDTARWLYVTRKRSASRYVANENEVVDILESRGFEIVELEGLTVREQIELFYGAQVVVSPHGAGLANLVHCFYPPKVVELIPRDRWTFGYFLHLVAGLGGEYQAVLGGSADADGGYVVDAQEIVHRLIALGALERNGFPARQLIKVAD